MKLVFKESTRYARRGDSALWVLLRKDARSIDFPDEQSAQDYLWKWVKEKTGVDLSVDSLPEWVEVPGLKIGHGLSDGYITPLWWKEKLIPAILKGVKLGSYRDMYPDNHIGA